VGWRGTTNTLLNFGEGQVPGAGTGQAGAVGYLVGQPGKGLHCMFHMMNEARIGVGMAATMLGMAGYHASLDYAKNRPQGRPMGAGGKDAAQPQVRIIEHADVKRMLLAQKAIAKARWRWSCTAPAWWTSSTPAMPAGRRRRALLLEVLTPHCQELAQRVVPGGQQPGHPDPRRLRLHARLSGGAVLARQPPEHDPRRHPRHPGAWTCWAARC
jgi:alkylation response protein AidB-like acyl-CoA dehydrogenase